jgi:DNA-binding MarR family transcriptional regulator
MGSQTISLASSPDTRRVLDALRWIVRELRLSQGGELSAAQRFVLAVLAERGPLSVGDLAEATATDPSSVSVVVRKLHEKGLVGKTVDDGDRRRLKVAISRSGAAEAQRGDIPAQQLLLGRLAELDPDQLKALADLLEKVAPQEGHPAPMFFHEGAAGGRR